MNPIDLNNRNAVVTGGARHSPWGTAPHMLPKTRWAALGTKNEAAAFAVWPCSEDCWFTAAAIFELSGSHATC